MFLSSVTVCVLPQVAVMSAAVRHLARKWGMGLLDYSVLMGGQERYLDPDGYHWPRHMNLRMFEMLLVKAHNKLYPLN